MSEHVAGKSIVITGAGGGFGRLVAQKAAARGARVTCGDIDAAAAQATVAAIVAAGGTAQALAADVTRLEEVQALVQAAVTAHGGVDVMVNNAGVMPLAFFSDHAAAHAAWSRCIDINIKGVLHGMIAAYDPMTAAGRGQIVNVSSIYGNFPVAGAAVYGATKAAVNFLSESFRLETRGRIKVTTVKPTGVPATGLAGSIVNPEAVIGILGANAPLFTQMVGAMRDGSLPPANLDPEHMDYVALAPEHIADAILHAIDQPWGVSIGEITVRAAGDHFVL
ncbi:MAG: SDR family NAD(P)-dependent oxidoreductase [Phenylobacterium sp.]|uniref:SDR family oxidoreductase n=1 Tax=Phenylobacterium sp. TaxID=1871053 RepID=UPI001A466AC0|nr:SDR family NAD(P)-dependent oxidoreductase [Phenylobacterium sp.]MBL8773486.1 SDR family NAD(P)-dependent oxidoreductase [Phenylobacterium sp.]